MKLVRSIRDQLVRRRLQTRRQQHCAPFSSPQKQAIQLDLFNRQWRTIRETSAFYKSLAHAKQLPAVFASWSDVIHNFPVVNRQLIQEHGNALWCQSRRPQWWRTTGGSTAQPIQLPAWNLENRHTTSDLWMARSWYGVSPCDRLFLLWGHSHLLGKGIGGWLRGVQRKCRDQLIGTLRFSAYDLSQTNLRQAAAQLLSFRPAFVIGYSVALDRFARANADLKSRLRQLGVKVVIGAAEGFPHADSVSLLRDLFDAPVAMEYGSVETSLIAHASPEGGYEVFWNTYFVEALEGGPNGGTIIRITGLYPRCFPLIRFELGDEIDLYPGTNGLGVERFSGVRGRCNAFLDLPDGTKIHSEAITHCVRGCSLVTAYQAVHTDNGVLLRYTCDSPLDHKAREGIRATLARIHPYLQHVTLQQVDRLQQSLAGKTPMIIHHATHNARSKDAA